MRSEKADSQMGGSPAPVTEKTDRVAAVPPGCPRPVLDQHQVTPFCSKRFWVNWVYTKEWGPFYMPTR